MSTTPFEVQVGGDHYRKFKIHPAEFITKNEIGFLAGCVITRLCRYKSKDGRKDLEKAIHEIELLMEMEYPEPPFNPEATPLIA